MRVLSMLLVLCFVFVAQGQTTITGTLVGSDGKPMAMAHVHLVKPGLAKPQVSVPVGKKGSFVLTASSNGLTFIEFTGVNHSPQRYFILSDKPVKLTLDVQLRSYAYLSELKNVSIIGDFNDFNFSIAQKMKKQEDGTYIAEFETAAHKFRYQIVGVTQTLRGVNGTQSESFEYAHGGIYPQHYREHDYDDNGGNYRSVITPKDGKAKIVFDPAKLLRSNSAASITVQNNPFMQRFFSLQEDMNRREVAYANAFYDHMKAGRDIKTFVGDWSAEAGNLMARGLKLEIVREQEPLLRKVLLVNYIRLAQLGVQTLDKSVAMLALEEVEFSSPLWSVHPFSLLFAIDVAGIHDRSEEYLDRFIVENPEQNEKVNLLYNEVLSAKSSNKIEKLRKYYPLLVNDYGHTQLARKAKGRLTPDSKVTINKPVPNFSVVPMEDSKQVYTKESFKGKYYLIDFWAVWCSPCIAEMENLHKAYERYKDKNFQILSLSFDAKPEDVVKFRKDKWKMPWLNVFVEGGLESEIAARFEVIGIPKPILVDPAGKIVAIGNDLRGENLDKTLTRLLSGRE